MLVAECRLASCLLACLWVPRLQWIRARLPRLLRLRLRQRGRVMWSSYLRCSAASLARCHASSGTIRRCTTTYAMRFVSLVDIYLSIQLSMCANLA